MKMLQWVDPIMHLLPCIRTCTDYLIPFSLYRTILRTTSVPVSLATLEGTVRWRLMSVCFVLVRMEEHVLILLTGTTATAAVSFR